MRTSRLGQAAYEFAIASFVFAGVVAVLVACAPLLTRNLDMLDDARTDAGVAALTRAQGSRTTAMDGATRIAARTRVPPGWRPLGGRDAWEYPVRGLPAETRFPEWRDGAPRPVGLVYGGAKDSFEIPVWFDGEGARTKQDVRLSEEVLLPALGTSSRLP